MDNLIQKNIRNLTDVWERVGDLFHGVQQRDHITLSIVPNSSWPNRIWTSLPTSIDSISQIKNRIKSFNHPIVVPVFDEKKQLWEEEGFEFKFQQIGMILPMAQAQSQLDTSSLILVKVHDHKTSNVWAELFQQAFGYEIPSFVVETSKNSILYYIAYVNQVPVGTAILHQTKDTIGVHAMGVIPSQRKKGYAALVMDQLIQKGIEANVEYMTLQASAMGKNLYLKMGFQEQFLMNNYLFITE